MISAVLDTNTLVSGVVTAANSPGQILDAWRDGLFALVISKDILDELKHVFQKSYFQSRLSQEYVNSFIELLENEAILTPLAVKVSGVATHPEDDLILSAAVSAEVNYFVTGDGFLLRKVGKSYKEVKIVTPSDFLLILKHQS